MVIFTATLQSTKLRVHITFFFFKSVDKVTFLLISFSFFLVRTTSVISDLQIDMAVHVAFIKLTTKF